MYIYNGSYCGEYVSNEEDAEGGDRETETDCDTLKEMRNRHIERERERERETAARQRVRDSDKDRDRDRDRQFFCMQTFFCVYVLPDCVSVWGTERLVRAMSEYL